MIYWPNQKPALNKLWAAQRCQNIKYKRIKKWKSWVNVLFEEVVNYERGNFFLGWGEKWINGILFHYFKKVFHYWHFQVAPGPFIWMMHCALNVFLYECVLLISYILKKRIIAVSFHCDWQNGRWQSGREMKCYYQGTYCLCAISFGNCSASSSHRINGNPGSWKAFHHPWGNLPDCLRLSRLERNVMKADGRGWQGWGDRCWPDNKLLI